MGGGGRCHGGGGDWGVRGVGSGEVAVNECNDTPRVLPPYQDHVRLWADELRAWVPEALFDAHVHIGPAQAVGDCGPGRFVGQSFDGDQVDAGVVHVAQGGVEVVGVAAVDRVVDHGVAGLHEGGGERPGGAVERGRALGVQRVVGLVEDPHRR